MDNSTIAYDSGREPVLLFRKPHGRTPYDGQVYALDMKSHSVQALSPEGMHHNAEFAFIDRCCYDPANDLVLVATHLLNRGDRTPTRADHAEKNRWISLDIRYAFGKRNGQTTRVSPTVVLAAFSTIRSVS